MSKAILLHTIEDADHCIQLGLHEGNVLLSTHSTIDTYLEDKHGVKCRVLSYWMDSEDVLKERTNCADRWSVLIKELGEGIAPVMQKLCPFQMDFIKSLYSYYGAIEYHGIYCMEKALKRVEKDLNITEFNFYQHIFKDLFATDIDIQDFVDVAQFEIAVKVLYRSSQKKGRKTKYILKFKKLFKLLGSGQLNISKIWKSLNSNKNFKDFKKENKTILSYDPLYNFEFLKEGFKEKHNVIQYPTVGNDPVSIELPRVSVESGANDIVAQFKKLIAEKRQHTDASLNIMLQVIAQDFALNYDQYIQDLTRLDQLQEEYPISMGIWGNPPIEKFKALVFEYLKMKKVPVVGGQHGGRYGVFVMPQHYDSDYGRCDHFFTYGFDQSDLKRGIPDLDMRCQIHAVGRHCTQVKTNGRKKVDIIFPVTNSLSLFEGGLTRILPHELTDCQIRTIEYLDSLEDLEIYVKPFNGANYMNCSVLPTLRKTKNIKIIDYMNFSDFLKNYEPKASIIEFPSTPLYDVMHFDSEIFVMEDPVTPFESGALELLEKRAYVCKSTDDLLKRLKAYVDEDIIQKRDEDFYNRYVHRAEAYKNITSSLDEYLTVK